MIVVKDAVIVLASVILRPTVVLYDCIFCVSSVVCQCNWRPIECVLRPIWCVLWTMLIVVMSAKCCNCMSCCVLRPKCLATEVFATEVVYYVQ